ncbi:MAG TPA: YdjY domain-containing protein [Gemmataceae bacterium]|nr:YdjY domain-containing protein [Gemmataceae bacterium]
MCRTILAALPLLAFALPAQAYIEAPHSLGKCVHESTNVVLIELTKINTDKGLLIFKKVADIKGKSTAAEIKHNIGKRGFHEREWKNVMAWAEVGKKAVFMYNAEASETCIGTYWYQCYKEGDWWGMSHAEPFLLRTFYGDPDKLADLCTRMLKGEEVIATCLADGSKEQLHQRKGKLQRMKASLKKLDYDPKKDFVGFGGDGDVVEEFKSIELMAASTGPWKYISVKKAGATGGKWIEPTFDDSKWSAGKAPIGYGEEEIDKRKGTTIKEEGQDFLFRRQVEVPAELLEHKGVIFRIGVASDDTASVFVNGKLVDKDPEEDHEFAYWNREAEVPIKVLKPGRNLIAVLVKNKQGSSDLYMDLELIAQYPLPAAPKKKTNTPAIAANTKEPVVPVTPVVEEPRDPDALKVDKAKKTVTVAGVVALRKLPNLDQRYPIEVIGTYPAPRGQKAHETVLTFKGVRPSDVHKALESLGLKPGKPAYGEGQQAVGPELKVYIELPGKDGKLERVPVERCLMHIDSGKSMSALKWYFTGSIQKQPDPEKDDKVYGADLTGTFLSIFPVTDCCVLQSQLTMKDEPNFKLETDSTVLPKEGTAVKLVIVAE